jgi:hypothetical protein
MGSQVIEMPSLAVGRGRNSVRMSGQIVEFRGAIVCALCHRFTLLSRRAMLLRIAAQTSEVLIVTQGRFE